MASRSAPKRVNKSSAEWKEQYTRSHARFLEQFSKLHHAVNLHRGSQSGDAINTVHEYIQELDSEAKVQLTESTTDVLDGICFTPGSVGNVLDPPLRSRIERLGCSISDEYCCQSVNAVRAATELYNGSVSKEECIIHFLVHGSWYEVDYDILAARLPQDTLLGDLLEIVLPNILDLHVHTDPMEPCVMCDEIDDYTFVCDVPAGRALSISFEAI